MKAVVAMSGGVDSSVAAHLLKTDGYEVIGLSFELWDKRDLKSSNVCCSIETIEMAKSVAQTLKIDHYTADVRDSFYRNVIETFCESYLKGETPNPCILCNKFIKFDFLIEKARELGADVVATGHYARVERPEPAARFLLKKAVDNKKDQSYVLYVLTQEQLSQTIFPLGNITKDDTRSLARELDLAAALRPESQEICFVGDESYTNFNKEFAPESLKPGVILDTSGHKIGKHNGIAFYTIGQRRGLGISSPSPLYVINIDRQNNTIIAGSERDAMKKTFKVSELNWISRDRITEPIKALVKIRSTMQEKPAWISPDVEKSVIVEFVDAQWAPAPGQSAVFYQEDTVIGGGIIE